MPVFMTSKARDATDCQWSICYDLPVWNWTRRGYASGTAAKPLARDEVTAGTAYALQTVASGNSAYLWRTTNYGVNWSHVGTISNLGTGGNFSEPLLLPIRGNAGHLFVTSNFTSGGNAGIWFSTDGGASWQQISLPAGFTRPQRFAIGAPYGGYPKLYGLFTDGTTSKLFSTIFNPSTLAVNWQQVGPTGITTSDFPGNTQLAGITTLTADPVCNDLLYSASGSNGFVYFGDTQVPVHLHW